MCNRATALTFLPSSSSSARSTHTPIPNRAAITGAAHYLPDVILDNAIIAARLGVTEAWILQRTGIAERQVSTTAGTSHLILPAARACLERAGRSATDLDCIIVATSTPDFLMPSTAALVQHGLGATCAWGFDLNAACSGFLYALTAGAGLIESGRARRVLLCAADRMSCLVNPNDPCTSILFGDGAGVVLLEASEDPSVGVLDCLCAMDGAGAPELCIRAAGSAHPATDRSVAACEHTMTMNGRAVFQAAVTTMVRVSREVLERNSLATDDLAWFVPHQANARIITAVGRELGVCPSRVASNIARFGNTTAATIPICLSEMAESGLMCSGDRLLLTAFGAGFTAASAYVRWS